MLEDKKLDSSEFHTLYSMCLFIYRYVILHTCKTGMKQDVVSQLHFCIQF